MKKKKKKKPCGTFFSVLMLKIPSINELLHKPSEIQWNITGAFPGNLKMKIGHDPTKYYPLKSQKKWGIAFYLEGGGYFGGLETNMEFNGFLWFYEFLKFPASVFWLKTVLSLN